MSELDRERLRSIFDEDAARYQRARPGYPPAMFDDLARLAGIGPGCRVLEIGPGTGQASVPLAARGCRLVAVELGTRLAALARANLAGYPLARVEVAAFERWPLPAEPFDVVLAATALHWLDPAVRFGKAADALRSGGVLAVVETHHVAAPPLGDPPGGPADDPARDEAARDEAARDEAARDEAARDALRSAGFFVEMQDCYERFDPATPPGLRPPAVEDIPAELPGLVESGRFGPPVVCRYVRHRGYRTGEYLDLLLTYSGHRALPGPARRGLLACVAGLIDGRYQGRITKTYLTQLLVATRLEGAHGPTGCPRARMIG